MIRIFFAFLFFSSSLMCFAQKRIRVHANDIKNVVIDGDLSEWREALLPVSEANDFAYHIAQDEKNIYIAILIQDNTLQSMATIEGISIRMEAEEKGNKDAVLWFPYADDEVRRALMREDRDQRSAADLKNALMQRSRGYYAYGFSGTPEGLLAINNSYGLAAQGKLTDSLGLTYEVVIAKDRWDFNKSPFNMKLEIHEDRSELLAKKQTTPGRNAHATVNGNRRKSSKRDFINKVLLEIEL
ncbi:hypothetical protein HP439_01560 [Sphingobacterium shayense]|uniref:hypothetical protein n=1 Tax=Sphingobacterium shayense TaxID=626343 RepID=UPI0015565C45|nr:hypothetical protein [Sphingobacterium shayense]NQD69410.1 hypothetical protein [Sphingobacterium shayense]